MASTATTTAMAASTAAVRRLTPSGAKSLLSGVKYVMLDIDGVIWAGDHVIDGIPETLRWLQDDMGISVRFMTNNSTKTRMDTVDKFHGKGMTWVHEDLVMTSAYASTTQLLKHGDATGDTVDFIDDEEETTSKGGKKRTRRVYDRNVFVLGDKGLHTEVRRVLHPSKTTYGYEMVHPSLLPHLVPHIHNKKEKEDIESSVDKERMLASSFTNFPYSPAVVLKSLDHPVVPIGGILPTTSTSKASGSSSGYVRAELGDVQELVKLSDLNVGAIISGLDPNLNYHKVATAGLILQVHNAKQKNKRNQNTNAEKDGGICPGAEGPIPWIQTNPDQELPMQHVTSSISNNDADNSSSSSSHMFFLPGAGTTEGLMTRYLCRGPDKVCGKPHPDMAFALFDKLLAEKKEQANIGEDDCVAIDPAAEVLMVGDRVSTDIVFGRRAGCKTMLVLSGCENESHVEGAPEEDRPDFVAASLSQLREMYQSQE